MRTIFKHADFLMNIEAKLKIMPSARVVGARSHFATRFTMIGNLVPARSEMYQGLEHD
jgi:hypothetical protein